MNKKVTIEQNISSLYFCVLETCNCIYAMSFFRRQYTPDYLERSASFTIPYSSRGPVMLMYSLKGTFIPIDVLVQGTTTLLVSYLLHNVFL